MKPAPRPRAVARDARAFTINVEEPWQLRWWADHFGVPVPILLATIARLGNDANVVRVLLEGNPQEQDALRAARTPQAQALRLSGRR